MEGITEVFTSFLPQVTTVGKNDKGEVVTAKKFSAGGLVAMFVYVVLGAGIGAVI